MLEKCILKGHIKIFALGLLISRAGPGYFHSYRNGFFLQLTFSIIEISAVGSRSDISEFMMYF